METQRNKVLRLLRTSSICSWDFTYKHSIKQAPTRVNELKHEGYDITSVTCKHSHDRAIDYVLHETPKEEYTYIFKDGIGYKVVKSSLKPEQLAYM